QCKWVCDEYEQELMWFWESGVCPTECPCPEPPHECVDDCEIAYTNCGFPTTTTTLEPTTTTTDTTTTGEPTTTTTTEDPCEPDDCDCGYICTDIFYSYFWILCEDRCSYCEVPPYDWTCEEPQITCNAGNEGAYTSTDCQTTTTTTTCDPTDCGGNCVYVCMETSPDVYEWVLAGNYCTYPDGCEHACACDPPDAYPCSEIVEGETDGVPCSGA
ncbi:MAG: hypothetical protein ACYSVY_15680, partial [Planctomycetota bacterium]